jgi:hypothetical protein
MNLYIETENGTFKNHPAFEDNLIQAFGSVPAHWEPFTRIERPIPDIYQVLESNESVYEKAALHQACRDAFNSRPQAENWSAWSLDEATCTMVPPIPRPAADETKIAAGIMTFWCGADANWKDTPVRPEGEYKFDFLAWQWIEVTIS